jgi:hypothetical protein
MLEESGWKRLCNISKEMIPNLIGRLNGKKEFSVEKAIAELRSSPKNILKPGGEEEDPWFVILQCMEYLLSLDTRPAGRKMAYPVITCSCGD